MASTAKARGGRSYDEKRDFARTPEPRARKAAPGREGAPIFVVQRHDASRLHYDFRLEHGGVLWSWAVPKGPSLDPADKRLAVHVEDHPVDYASFEGTIPEGNYGAGEVEIWDCGTWEPLGDPDADLARGEMKFRLSGGRVRGGYVLVRLKPRRSKAGKLETAENWLLIKERDDAVEAGIDADAMAARAAPGGASVAAPAPAPAKTAKAKPRSIEPAAAPPKRATKAKKSEAPRAAMPDAFRPALATLVEEAPKGTEWVSEIKFDGYRLIVRKDGDDLRLLTRNGLDWTAKLPHVAASLARIPASRAVLDGELVALDRDGATSFALLQAALGDKRDDRLLFFAFDLLFLDDDDLRPRPLLARKALLEPLCAALPDAVRFSEHLTEDAARIRTEVCRLGLEGIVCKRADAPYREGRGRDWVKVKCDTRDEMVVLGWTRPKGTRQGLGSLHLGFRDDDGALHYAGGCGSGFSDETLGDLTARLAGLKSVRPKGLIAEEKPPTGLNWVRPELVVEVKHAGLTPAGMLRHARFLGLREDKPADEVVRSGPVALPAEPPAPAPERPASKQAAAGRKFASTEGAAGAVAARDGSITADGVRISHADRDLWPGISKRALVAYWEAVADIALPGVAGRPLALLRCPDGVAGQSFFQKHLKRGFPRGVGEGAFDEAPYLSIDDLGGLAALVQMSTIEVHSWGSSLEDPGHADRLVFDLDPDERVPFADVVVAAQDIRRALEAVGVAAFPRTTGGKGLHLVVPVETGQGWDAVRAWSRGFAAGLEKREPKRFIASTTRKDARRGKILIDWLRNGLGSTAVASFSPRARPGAPVATPLAWSEVTKKLDPSAFDVTTVPKRLARRTRDPWDGFHAARAALPPSGQETR